MDVPLSRTRDCGRVLIGEPIVVAAIDEVALYGPDECAVWSVPARQSGGVMR